MLELRDLVKHYPEVGGEPVRAVDGVSMTVEPGEMVALYGPTRLGQDDAAVDGRDAAGARPAARCSIGGRDISSLSEREASHFRLSELGFIRQNFDLLPGVTRDRQRGAEAAEERCAGARRTARSRRCWSASASASACSTAPRRSRWASASG